MNKIHCFLSSLILFVITSCSEQASQAGNGSRSDTPIDSPTIPTVQSNQVNADDLVNYSELVPLEIKDSQNKNVFEKFGIDFNGNCYACDLASIHLTDKNFDLINVCNENISHRFEQFSYSLEGDNLIVKTPQIEFQFIKIDEAPVYRLELGGNEFRMKAMKLSTYYTNRDVFSKFKDHDCGDFQG